MDNQTSSPGFLTSLKNTLSPSALVERFHITSTLLVEASIYLSVGFLVGFLLKKYGKIIFFTVLFFALVMLAQRFDLITLDIHWDTIQKFFGFEAVTTNVHQTTPNDFWGWIQSHLIVVLCGLGGFLLGLRLG